MVTKKNSLYTGSLTTNSDGSNYTGVGLSTQVLIIVNDVAVGAIQTLSVKEGRQITMVDEVGTDGHIDSAPTKSTNVTGSCKRIRFNRRRIAEAFGRDFLHTHSQRIPFDIEIHDRWLGEKDKTVVTTIKNVWINDISYDYNSADWLVFDTMGWEAETIFTTYSNGESPVTGITKTNYFEQQSDMGNTRGTMSDPGLLSALFNDDSKR